MDQNMFLLIFGLFFTATGALIVFNARFMGYLRRTFWRPNKFDKSVLSPEGIRRYARFQGLMSLLVGIFALLVFLFHI